MLKQHRWGMSKLLVLLYTAALLTGHWMPIGFARVDAPTPVPLPVEDDRPTAASPGKPVTPVKPPAPIAPPTQPAPAPTIDTSKWKAYLDKKTGATIKYPKEWYLKVKEGQSVVSGFDAFLLATFDLDLILGGATYVPDGEAVIGLDFLGSDYDPKSSLISYLDAESLHDDRVSRVDVLLKDRKVVKENHEGGTTYAFANGQNVYSIYSFSANSKDYQPIIEAIVASISFSNSTKISYPAEAKIKPTGDLGRGEIKTQESGSKLAIESVTAAASTVSTQVTSLPSMKLPWGAGGRKYNSGPHDSSVAKYNCTYLADVQKMNSLDFGFSTGQDVLAAADGTVAFTRDEPGLGLVVAIDHAGGLRTKYAHLSNNRIVTAGEYVKQGMVIGVSGCTGSGCGGSHLL